MGSVRSPLWSSTQTTGSFPPSWLVTMGDPGLLKTAVPLPAKSGSRYAGCPAPRLTRTRTRPGGIDVSRFAGSRVVPDANTYMSPYELRKSAGVVRIFAALSWFAPGTSEYGPKTERGPRE